MTFQGLLKAPRPHFGTGAMSDSYLCCYWLVDDWQGPKLLPSHLPQQIQQAKDQNKHLM